MLDVRLGIAVLVALCLGACGGSSAPRASTPSSESTTSSTVKFVCDPSRADCTTADVIATVRQIYEIAGATTAESSCLAPISAAGKHAVMQSFDAFSDAQTRAALRCVGSDARMQAIVDGLIRKFPGVGQGSEACSTEGEQIAPISGSPPPPKRWWTLSPAQLRAAGWRIVRQPSSKQVCSSSP
jgi:hypothetical protein